MKARLLAALAAAALLLSLAPAAAAAEPPEVTRAAGACLYNVENDVTLLAVNDDARIFPASTVKLMTGILALEALGGDMTATITVTSEMLSGVVGNNIGLKTGEIVTVGDMLHALLVNGSNDAAQVLAVAAAGSVDAFVAQMNQKAQLLGAYSTYYTNPTGMHSDGMITTVADTLAIARYAYRLPGFIDITSVSKYVMDTTNKSDYRNLYNRNAQLSKFYDTRYYYPDALGMNAGYTAQAGYCLVSAAQRNSLTYLCVVMNAEDDDDGIYSYENARTLLDWAFESYAYLEVLSDKERVAEMPVSLSSAVDYVTLVPAAAIVRYLPADTDLSRVRVASVTHGETLVAPVEAGQICGTVTVTLDDEILGSVDLVATTSVSRSEFLYMLERVKAFTSGRFFRASVVFLIVFSVLYVLWEARRREQLLRRRR